MNKGLISNIQKLYVYNSIANHIYIYKYIYIYTHTHIYTQRTGKGVFLNNTYK